MLPIVSRQPVMRTPRKIIVVAGSALVSWEFLEARNEELSAKLGVPVRPLELFDDKEESHVAVERGQIPFNPVVIAALDEDEATYMIANALINRRAYDRVFPKGRPSWIFRRTNYRYLNAYQGILRGFGILLSAGFAYIIAGNFGPVFWIVLIVSLAFEFASLRGINIDQPKFQAFLADACQKQFLEVAQLAEVNPQAGERFMRKAFILRQTEYGTKPLSSEGREKARKSYEMNVPPQFQVPNAI